MLKRAKRLTKDKDFDNVFKRGRSAYSQILGVKIEKNDLSYNRFGVLVGTKVSKKAVDRNKIKRRIRAIIHNEEPFLKTGYDCVFIVLPLILAKSYDEIKSGVKAVFLSSRLYK
jgi:ribonuclease P protein component